MKKANAECRVHSEEPCGVLCNAECDTKWHHRPAVRGGNLCRDCRECDESRATTGAADRAYQSGYAYASGYHH